jgi:hypothetical protein
MVSVVRAWAAMPLALLLAAAALVSVGSAQPSVAQRTHTFKSYQQDSTMRDLVPVFVSTVKILLGTYAQDDIVDLGSGVDLDCRPYAPDDSTNCSLTEAWRKPRRASEAQYTQMALGNGCPPFAMKYQSGNLRLMISTKCLAKEIYDAFGDPTPQRELAWVGGSSRSRSRSRSSKNYAAKAAAKWEDKHDDVLDPSTMGVYYDPWGADGVTPYWPGLTAAEIRREERQAEKARRRFAKLHRREQIDFARYDRWVRKQLKIKKGQDMTLTAEQVDYYYANPPVTNKHYPWRWVFDHSGVFLRPSPAFAGTSSQSAGSDAFKALNEGRTIYIGNAVCLLRVL